MEEVHCWGNLFWPTLFRATVYIILSFAVPLELFFLFHSGFVKYCFQTNIRILYELFTFFKNAWFDGFDMKKKLLLYEISYRKFGNPFTLYIDQTFISY